MITVNLSGIEKDFGGANSLFAERQAQYSFVLMGASGKMRSPHVTLIQSDYSKQGSIDLIEFIKTQALATVEVWGTDLPPNYLMIRYWDWDNVVLGFSDETPEEMGEEKLLVSEDVSETGLVNLVDELLNYMR